MLSFDVRKRLDKFSLDMRLELDGGGITAVFGPSGAGKTTLARLLAGLAAPDEGHIEFDGEIFFDGRLGIDLPPERRGVGYMFQEHRLFPHMSVYQNLNFGSFAGGRRLNIDLRELAEFFGIAGLLKRSPASLSGGESQRAALARAILSATSFIVMDEPLSSLDEKRRWDLVAYIAEIPRRFHVPVLYITHSREEVMRLADRAFTVEAGRITGYGRPEEILPTVVA